VALTRQQKEERVAKVEKDISSAVSIVFMSYDGLTVEDSEALRDQLQQQGARLRVISKRLLKIILDRANLAFDPVKQAGQVAFVWGNDAIAPAKVLHGFAKKKTKIQIVGGIMEGSVLSSEQVKQLATLPGKDEMRAQLVGTIAGPIRGFVSVLSGTQRNFLYALSAIRDQKPSA